MGTLLAFIPAGDEDEEFSFMDLPEPDFRRAGRALYELGWIRA